MSDTRIYELLRLKETQPLLPTDQRELEQLRLEFPAKVAEIEMILSSTRGIARHQEEALPSWDRMEAKLLLAQPGERLAQRKKTWPLFLLAALLIGLLALSYWWINRNMPEPSAYAGTIEQIDLPDGSDAYVYEGSSLRMNENYGAEERRLYANGDVYIQADKDDKPMVVKSGRFEVRVIGTAFSISDYLGERGGCITLYEGSIKAKMPDENWVDMEAGQHLFWSERLQTYELVNTPREQPYWMEGDMVFHNSPFEEVFISLTRRHGATFTGVEVLDGLHFTDNMEDGALSAVLTRIEKVANVRILEIEENRYHIQKR